MHSKGPTIEQGTEPLSPLTLITAPSPIPTQTDAPSGGLSPRQAISVSRYLSDSLAFCFVSLALLLSRVHENDDDDDDDGDDDDARLT